jgi:NAD(P)-dependent dehydrogenase (short-subunit alcohol dehydrogenase family)
VTGSPFELTGKTAIVTGSTRGIGRAIAEAMSRAGATVVVSSENADETGTVAACLKAEGHAVHGIACDVTDPAQCKALVAGAIGLSGGIDILVCNAGITGKPGPLATMAMTDYAYVMDVNLTSMVTLTKLALPHIAIRHGGSVILIASLAALRGNGAINAYAIAKAGVVQLARNLAVEWGPRGVRVNAISPGLIATTLSEPLLSDEAFMTRRMAMTPLRRPGTPEEVAGAALFLATPAGGFVNGHNLVVDGGTVITDGS